MGELLGISKRRISRMWVTLIKLIGRIIPAGLDREKVQSYLEDRLNAQAGRTGAKSLARAVYKAIAEVMGPNTPAAPVDRIALGMALADQAAEQALEIGPAIEVYSLAQATLEGARGTDREPAARQAREKAEVSLTEAFIDVVRAAIGDKPRG